MTSKEIINITEITSYLFCPRKVYLARVEKIKEPANKIMIVGYLKHKIFDLLNKKESSIVSQINKNLTLEEIFSLYKSEIINLIQQTCQYYQNMIKQFDISPHELQYQTLEFLDKEIILRGESILKSLEKGFRGIELWQNLTPKYLTEFEVISEKLGLKGRIDRIKFEEQITPYELKTRSEIYEGDKFQLAAYALLLEKEYDKEIKKGIIETSTQKQEIDITEEDKNLILETADIIRNLTKGKIPELPSNFNKCKSCRIRAECFDI